MYKQWKVYYSEYYKKTKMKNFLFDEWLLGSILFTVCPNSVSQCVPTVCHSVSRCVPTVSHCSVSQQCIIVCSNSVSQQCVKCVPTVCQVCPKSQQTLESDAALKIVFGSR